MGNKITSINSSQLLDNKLAVLLENLNSNFLDGSESERETILIDFNKTINKFYQTLYNPILQLSPVKEGVDLNLDQLNEYFKQMDQDLKILFREVNSLHRYAINNFNTLSTHSSALRSRLRRIDSDLDDFRLQAESNLTDAIFFSDGYRNTEQIDYDNKLYKEEVCSIDIHSNAIQLPLDLSKTKKHSITNVSIGSGSNGTAGNNQELSALHRADLKSIVDDNPDTWFEYESVSQSLTNLPLALELRLSLDKPSIINVIELSSMAFATRNYVKLVKLEVSNDGREFTSILDEVFTEADSDKSSSQAIILDPSAGKFAGINRLKFTPREVSYMNIVLQQDDSYTIKTTSGLRYRKAIGIRDINLMGEAYLDKGEIASVEYYPSKEIKKVALQTNEISTPNLTDITNYISIDNGQNWIEIQPISERGREVPEIINFNLEGIESIDTTSPINSIRYRGLLKRLKEGFSSRGGTERRRKLKTEFLNISPSSQSIGVTEKPIGSTVSIKNVSYGSVGGDSFYLIGSGEKIERDDRLYIYLPSIPFDSGLISEDQEILKINNEVWSRVSSLSGAASSEKIYEFDYLNNIIKFGNDINGKKPTGDIFLGLKRERVSVLLDEKKTLDLAFDSDEIKETTRVYRLEDETSKAGHIFAKDVTVHRSGVTDISDITIVTDINNILSAEKVFINGAEEFIQNGDYSIDYSNGIIYTYSRSPKDSDVVIDIIYSPRIKIEDFSFIDGKITIEDKDYVSVKINDTQSIVAQTNVIDLDNSYVEPRSLVLVTPHSSLSTEVPFKGDGTEFNLPLSPAELVGYYTIDYKRGRIYTYSPVTVGAIVFEYNTSRYYAEYNMAILVPRTDYTVDEESQVITFSDNYIIKNFSDSLDVNSFRTLYKIKYEFVIELEQDAKKLESFYTPMLRDYSLTIL